MKVAIVTTRHSAQDDRIYYKEALSLAKRMDVTMIAPDDGETLEWAASVTFRSIPRRRSVLGRLWSLVEATSEVYRQRPDFCHVHDLDLALAIPFIRIITKAKIIYDSHEVFTRKDLILNGRFRSRVGKGAARLVESVENWLVGVGHHVITAVDPGDRAYRGLKIPLSVIFNYPPLSIFETNPQVVKSLADRLRDRLPVIYQGSMSEDRGLFHMLDAMVLVKEKEPRVVLRLIGLIDGELRLAAENRISELGLGDNVRLEGWLPHDKIALAIKTSLVGLIPLQPNEKYDHALPIKLLEYMACGIPVIAGQLSLVGKYINDCGGGRLYDSTRAEELARNILDLLSDDNLRRELGQNGLRAVQERWNWEKMEEVLFEVYDSLLGEQG